MKTYWRLLLIGETVEVETEGRTDKDKLFSQLYRGVGCIEVPARREGYTRYVRADAVGVFEHKDVEDD